MTGKDPSAAGDPEGEWMFLPRRWGAAVRQSVPVGRLKIPKNPVFRAKMASAHPLL
jgi:hypothetical protein